MENQYYQPLLLPPHRSYLDSEEYSSTVIRSLHCLGNVRAERLGQQTDEANPLQQLTYANLISYFCGGFWAKCAETVVKLHGLTEAQVGVALYIIFDMWLTERVSLDWSFSPFKVVFNEHSQRLSGEQRIRLYELAGSLREGIRAGVIPRLDELCRPFQLRETTLKTLAKHLPKLFEISAPFLFYSCIYHNTKNVIPLLCNHSCDDLPTRHVESLYDHTGAVLCLKFSHNGRYLASCGSDLIAIVWEVLSGSSNRVKCRCHRHPALEKMCLLIGHTKHVTCVSWSPNDESLLTCAPRDNIRIWNFRKGTCEAVITEQVPVIRSCDFLLRDQVGIVYGRTESVHLVRYGCDVQLSGSGCFSIDDFVVTPNGKKLIYKVEKRKFTVVDIETGKTENLEEEEDAIIRGFSVSEDSESLVMSLSNNEIHVWDLNNLKEKPLTYWGNNKATIETSPCLGGVDSRFLACGADDGKVRIWNRSNGMPIKVLDCQHSSGVRCVAWNPKNPQMLACTGEYNVILIWGPESSK